MTMMSLVQCFQFIQRREVTPRHQACVHRNGVEFSQANRFVDSCSLSPQAQFFQGMESLGQLLSGWTSALTPNNVALAQPQEMSRGQETEVGPHTMQVDGHGNISVTSKPTELAMRFSGGGTTIDARMIRQEAPLKFSNGTVELPNGEKRPYGNTGIIVVMADGRQFAAGRNSKDSNENIRYVAADKGQDIPVSPPGNTTVLYLDEGGNVARQETR